MKAAGPGAEEGAEDDVGVADDGGLSDAIHAAGELPGVLPERLAGDQIEAAGATVGDVEQLLNAVDFGKLRGGVAPTVSCGPCGFSRQRIVCANGFAFAAGQNGDQAMGDKWRR